MDPRKIARCLVKYTADGDDNHGWHVTNQETVRTLPLRFNSQDEAEDFCAALEFGNELLKRPTGDRKPLDANDIHKASHT